MVLVLFLFCVALCCRLALCSCVFQSFYHCNHLTWGRERELVYVLLMRLVPYFAHIIWTASSESGTYRLCEQRRFRQACASAQSRQNLHCSLIQALSQEEPSDRKPDPWPLLMAWHAQLKFVMTECSKTQIRLTGLICDCGTPCTFLLPFLND